MFEIGLGQFPPGCTHELLIFLHSRCRRNTHNRVIAVCWNNFAGFPAQAIGSLPCLNGANTPPELLPKHDDTTICGPQVLQAMDSNGPLTDLGLVVTGFP